MITLLLRRLRAWVATLDRPQWDWDYDELWKSTDEYDERNEKSHP